MLKRLFKKMSKAIRIVERTTSSHPGKAIDPDRIKLK